MQVFTTKFSNPIIKDEIEIIFESQEKFIFRTLLRPTGGQSGLHYHTKISEEFKIITGELTVVINNVKRVLKRNEVVLVKPFDTHQFLNESSSDVLFEVTVTPAIEIKNGLQVIYGLADDNKVFKNGLPKNIFYAAIAIHMMDAYVPGLPLLIQKIGIKTFAFIGKKIGITKKLIACYCKP